MNRPWFSPSAKRDLLAMLEHIARDKPGAALQYVERLESECWMLAANSAIGTSREDLLPGLRCWSFGNYVIFFRPTSDGIDVVRVVHGSRNEGALFG
jgi:toxin ParE1/3/4